ncbi:MAG: hypothetical protein P1P59_07295 [Treponemataceae bacterium]
MAFSANELSGRDASSCINKIGENTEASKQYKMQAALKTEGHILDELYDELVHEGACEFCDVFPVDHTEDGKGICKHCYELIKTGEKLVKANKIVFHTEKLKSNASFGELIEIQTKAKRKENDKDFGYVINSFEPGFPVIHLPYIAPKKKNEKDLLTFEEIAKEAKGAKKLAMFKADIDNLGLVFTSSLRERMSLLRYAEISRILHYFFSAYYVHIVESNENYKNKIYTVFSGGDDICVVGAWDVILDFCYDFRQELQKLTNNNPSITISGGVALASSNLPVRNMATEAENQLDLSKAFSKNNHLKNAITVFTTTLNWEDYEDYLSDGKKLGGYIEDKELATAPVYNLIGFANRAKKVREGEVMESIWISHFKYMFARNIKAKDSDVTKIEELFRKFGVVENIEKSRISASYALYANRQDSQN